MGKRKKMRSSMKAVHEALTTFRTAVGAPSCLHPSKTHSFRDLLTNFNSIYYTSSPSSFSSTPSTHLSSSDSGFFSLNSKRFFFDPCSSKLITREPCLEELLTEESVEWSLRRESVPMAMASMDPYRDFRDSMDEMVEAHGLKDWSSLEELLQSYLRLNQRSAHGFIVQAFVDLIVYLASHGKIQHWPCTSPCITSFP